MIGNQIIIKKRTGSTNTLASQYLKEKELPEGTVIRAVEQSAGRGHRGNSWESEPGKNLTFSVILYPDFLESHEQFILSKMVSLALYDYLDPLLKAVRIKWPNDIYVNNDKIAGILIENSLLGSSLDYSILGIGVNVNQTIFTSDAPNPTSLKIVTGIETDLDRALNDLCKCLNSRYLQVVNRDTASINQDYLSRLYRFNDFYLYKTGAQLFTAKITGLDPYGAIILETETGEIRQFRFGELEYVI
ncbi:MAG: biotin--[acetyl-CoA-carboxylase] ligase [Bacteroidales bacterium]|nr:MAG: biotin--[acetyl-CoA-carboxylase] ligase [Bacteroidales bacterium]